MSMLDAISDFWKPAKKNQPSEKLNPNELQAGTTLGFGFVPQASLSGRRLQVSGINTYKFGEETLTSFVLSPEKDPNTTQQISMIIAEADEEHYLAISRRMTINDRMKMFESHDLEAIMEKPDATTLPCKDSIADFKGWTVASYKREMQGMKGHIFKGDYRKETLPNIKEAQEFSYTLLVSDNNEHAIEIEKYADGRVEIYATIYRRMSDIGEVTQPARTDLLHRPDLKLASSKDDKISVDAASHGSVAAPAKVEEKPAEKAKTVVQEPVKSAPVKLQEFEKPVAVEKPAAAPEKPKPAVQAAEAAKPSVQTATQKTQEEKKPMASNEPAMNGAHTDKSPTLVRPSESNKTEVRTVNKTVNGMDNESIECELRVANRIIDEAIRSEMRLSDVVRRIIELPVAHQEAVQLPVTLSDEDYALLAIRYGIPQSDRGAIKRRIMEDLGSFSDGNKKAA